MLLIKRIRQWGAFPTTCAFILPCLEFIRLFTTTPPWLGPLSRHYIKVTSAIPKMIGEEWRRRVADSSFAWRFPSNVYGEDIRDNGNNPEWIYEVWVPVLRTSIRDYQRLRKPEWNQGCSRIVRGMSRFSWGDGGQSSINKIPKFIIIVYHKHSDWYHLTTTWFSRSTRISLVLVVNILRLE